MKRMFGFVTLVGVISFIVVGCGRSDGPRAKLRGKVTLDGKAVTIGEITVQSEDGSQMAMGFVDKEGNYEIPNAPVGKVKIGLRKPQLAAGEQSAAVGGDMAKDAQKKGEAEGNVQQDMKKADLASKKAGEGKQKETIQSVGKESDEERKDKAERFKTIVNMNEAYQDPQRSTLSTTVAADGSTEYNLVVTVAPPSAKK